MKVLIIDPADFLGGAELFTTEITQSLSKKIDFTVLTNGKSQEYLKRLPSSVTKVIIDIPRLRPFRPITLLKTILTLRKFVQKNPIDIVHSNSVRAGIIAVFLQKPWTHFAHDFTFPRTLAFLFKKSEAIFTCSQGVRTDLIKKGIPKKKLYIIYNGIDIQKFKKIQKNNWSSENPVITIVGRIDRWKGQDIFLQTAQILQKQIPKAKFQIYGESSRHDRKTQEYEKELKEFINENNIKNVVFYGYKPIQKILSGIDILVHASTKPEPFGRTVLEALASGTPVIASDMGGAKEILTGDVLKNFLIAPGNPKLLSEKILWILRSEKCRKDYQKSAKERVQYFSLENITQKMRKVWTEINS